MAIAPPSAIALGFLAAKFRSLAFFVPALLFLRALCASAFGFLLRSSAAPASLAFVQFAPTCMMDSRPQVSLPPPASIGHWRRLHTRGIAPGPAASLPPAFSRLVLSLLRTSLRPRSFPSIGHRFLPVSSHTRGSPRQILATPVPLPWPALRPLPAAPAFHSPTRWRAPASPATPLAPLPLGRKEGQAIVDCAAPFWKKGLGPVPRSGGRSCARENGCDSPCRSRPNCAR